MTTQPEKSYSWTQPLCESCWPLWLGDELREPVTIVGAEQETCCHCGELTHSGIYVRIDPAGAFCAHPTEEQS